MQERLSLNCDKPEQGDGPNKWAAEPSTRQLINGIITCDLIPNQTFLESKINLGTDLALNSTSMPRVHRNRRLF
jgi:hypothetical protein